MAERGAIAFEPKVEFPDNAFEAARMYLALMAYPELGEGQPGERGCRLTEAFWEYYMWNWRRVSGLREVSAALAAPRFKTPRQRRLERAGARGRRRIMRRFERIDTLGRQREDGVCNATVKG